VLAIMLSCMHIHELLIEHSLCLVPYDLPIGKSGRSDRHPDPTVLDGTMLHRDGFCTRFTGYLECVFPEDLPSIEVQFAHVLVTSIAVCRTLYESVFMGTRHCKCTRSLLSPVRPRYDVLMPRAPLYRRPLAVDESAERDMEGG
jgi:hypothetical protein